ncbi:MAG: Holliday junction branch migration protein RuvA [Clostridiaceae bacterium]|nr:Holliday junction branch migration protein RuvA [Clostridiaceae bacterium]
MFEFIKGNLVHKGLDYVVVEVGGIGFRIYASMNTIAALGEANSQVTVHTHMNVKENEITLYGFATREELSSFEMLITVSGVGPRMALNVLSTLTSSELGLAVATEDYKTIAKSKGIGPKLAQRIILELKDKIKKSMDVDQIETAENTGVMIEGNIEKDAISALMVLGYSAKESASAVRKVYQKGLTLEETVKLALRKMHG